MSCVTSSWVWRQGRKLRRPDHVHGWWWEAVLGSDEHGQWAAQPAGTPTVLRDGSSFRMADVVVRCYPVTEWWVATFYGADRGVAVVGADGGQRRNTNRNAIYVDMSVPPEWTDAGVAFVDLTLDVVKRFDGTVAVLDEDEVEAEARLWSIPAEQLDRARHSRDRVTHLVTAGAGAFGGVAEGWRRRFVDCSGRLGGKSGGVRSPPGVAAIRPGRRWRSRTRACRPGAGPGCASRVLRPGRGCGGRPWRGQVRSRCR